MSAPSIVKIFCHDVIVYDDPYIYEFAEDCYKFWTVVGSLGELTIRETVGKVSLQQRIDNFIKNEYWFAHSKALMAPVYVAPAAKEDIALWAKSHPKEMLSFIRIRKDTHGKNQSVEPEVRDGSDGNPDSHGKAPECQVGDSGVLR